MAAKFLFVLCSSFILIQTIHAQCLPSNYAITGLNGLNYGPANLGISSLPNSISVQQPCSYQPQISIPNGVSLSSIFELPSGISIIADNLEIGGQVAVSGALPFTSAVSISGSVPTSGQAAVSYNCGQGASIISAGNPQLVNVGPSYGQGIASYGNGYVIGNSGCGCY